MFILYEVDFAAGESKNVAVSYRMTATADATKTLDYQYTYDYLLSPAKNWADFGSLSVNVYTSDISPYVVQSNIPLTSSENGVYTALLDGLPEGEFSFTTYSKPEITEADIKEASMQRWKNNIKFGLIYYWWLLALILIAVIVMIALIFRHRKRRRYQKNKES